MNTKYACSINCHRRININRNTRNLKDSVRPTLWERTQCSSGIGIRFASNSKRIAVRYNLLWNTHMAHMADTGLKGTDLYRARICSSMASKRSPLVSVCSARSGQYPKEDKYILITRSLI